MSQEEIISQLRAEIERLEKSNFIAGGELGGALLQAQDLAEALQRCVALLEAIDTKIGSDCMREIQTDSYQIMSDARAHLNRAGKGKLIPAKLCDRCGNEHTGPCLPGCI